MRPDRIIACITLALLASPMAPAAPVSEAPSGNEPSLASVAGDLPVNLVELRRGAGVYSMQFEFLPGSDYVTRGRRFGGVTVQDQGDGLGIRIFAEREGSEAVAQSWRLLLGNDDRKMLGAGVAAGTTHPERLNFLIGGTLRVNGLRLGNVINLGQGHRGWTNNWWVGSPEALIDAFPGQLRMADAEGAAFCIRPMSHKRFEVRRCEAPT